MILPDYPKRIDLSSSESFTIQVGVDLSSLQILLNHIEAAKIRFDRAPLLPRVVSLLEREIHVCSVSYTHRIEGGLLSESETDAALRIQPGEPCSESQLRVINIGTACKMAREETASPGWRLTGGYIRSIHEILSEGVTHERNRPGQLRDGNIETPIPVGDEGHGGRYIPPQFAADIERLLDGLIAWHDEITSYGVPALIRAPLVHFYFELIHPFWAGNGLVGRLLEASILYSSGYGLAAFCLWRYYAERVDRYYALFNESRKAAVRGEAKPFTPIVSFHLEAMLTSFLRKLERVSGITGTLLFEGELRRLRDENGINLRQYAIVTHLMASLTPISLDQLRRSPWYEEIYRRLADKTKQRDLRQLREAKLLSLDDSGFLRPGYTRPPI